MSRLPSEEVRRIHARMRGVVEGLRLPFSSRSWKGQTGNWLGVGIGTSIDFQDHRPYLPGDDPRYIDWLAYARSGQYTMKLYREEVSPGVDLVLDGSASMAVEPGKWVRTLELFYFAVESALQAGATLRCSLTVGRDWRTLPLPAVLGHRWDESETEARDAGPPQPPPLERVPMRHGALRVWISDLLFPGAPEPLLKALSARQGRGVIYCPFHDEEQTPAWDGNLEFVDCESDARRRQRVTPDLLLRYRDAYRRHFDLWQDLARKYDVPLARIGSEGDFLARLFRDGLPARAVEAWT